METIKSNSGCEMKMPPTDEACGTKDICEICNHCNSHCLEHMMGRFGYRMVKASAVQKSDFKSE